MKKQVKILSIVLMVIMLLASISSVVFAGGVLTDLEGKISTADTSKVTEVGGAIVGVIQAICIIAGVAILMVVGVKYMMGSAEEKAEYKKTIPAYLVGAILLFAAVPVVRWISEFGPTIFK